MDTLKIAWEIYGALKSAGADIGNASVPIIESVLDAHIQPDGNLILAAPDLLKALTEPTADSLSLSFPDDLDSLASLIVSFGWHRTGDTLRAKSQAIRAAIAAAKSYPEVSHLPFDGAQPVLSSIEGDAPPALHQALPIPLGDGGEPVEACPEVPRRGPVEGGEKVE